MTTTKHLLFWIAVIFAFALVVPLLVTPHQLWANVTSELRMVNGAFGEKDTYRISKTATNIYNELFEDSGAVGATKKSEVSEKEKLDADPIFGAGGRFIIGATNNYVTALSVMFFVVTLRFLILLSWLPYIVPFILAVIVEGIVRRKIKLSSIGSANAVKFAISKHILLVILVFPVIYLFLPIAFTPLFMPLWTLIVALPLMVLVSNIMPTGAS